MSRTYATCWFFADRKQKQSCELFNPFTTDAHSPRDTRERVYTLVLRRGRRRQLRLAFRRVSGFRGTHRGSIVFFLALLTPFDITPESKATPLSKTRARPFGAQNRCKRRAKPLQTNATALQGADFPENWRSRNLGAEFCIADVVLRQIWEEGEQFCQQSGNLEVRLLWLILHERGWFRGNFGKEK